MVVQMGKGLGEKRYKIANTDTLFALANTLYNPWH